MKKRLFLLLVFVLLLAFPAFAAADSGSTTVYITKSGECYHTGTCGYLKNSCIPISLGDAVAAGYRPCSRCHPPTLSEDTLDSLMEKYLNTPVPTQTMRPEATPRPTVKPSPSPSPAVSRSTPQDGGLGKNALGAAALFGGGYALASARKKRK